MALPVLESRVAETGGAPATQLLAAKVSDPEFLGNVRKFGRHFKGLFLIGNVRVRILPGQPASHSTGDSSIISLRYARQQRLFDDSFSVSGLQVCTISERNHR